MKSQTPSTLRSSSSRFSARREGRFFAIGLAALAPLASMAVVVPSAISVRSAKLDRQRVFVKLDERNQVARRVGAYAGDGTLAQVRAVDMAVRMLIPSQLRPIDMFGDVRSAATDLGLKIDAIRQSDSRGTSIPGSEATSMTGANSDAIMVDEVVVTFRGPIERSLSLVEELRSRGKPTLVLGFDMQRQGEQGERFQTELRLGFLRRQVSAAASAGSTDARGPQPPTIR